MGAKVEQSQSHKSQTKCFGKIHGPSHLPEERAWSGLHKSHPTFPTGHMFAASLNHLRF